MCCPRYGAGGAAFLELHAKAEEEIFYPALLQAGIAACRRTGVEDETRTPSATTTRSGTRCWRRRSTRPGSDSWYAAVAAANEANGDHMAEEEREGLTDFRRLASLQERHDLAVSFAAYEARNYGGVTPVDVDPETYVREEEQAVAPGGGRVAQRRQPQGPLKRRPRQATAALGTPVTGHGRGLVFLRQRSLRSWSSARSCATT